MSVRLAFLLAALLVALLPARVYAATVTVRLDDGLNPKRLTIAVGTTVRWVNASDDRHRMRSRSGPVEFDTHNLEPGDAYSFTFSRPGTYPYVDERDRDDSSFHGTIIVGGGAGEPAPAIPNPPSGGGGGAAPASATVHMAGEAFSPSSVTIAAGGSVTFVNDDDREHTATGDTFDTGVLDPGSQSKQSFPSAGTFSYLCAIHSDMRGTVNVRGSSGGAAPPAATFTPTPTPTPSATPPSIVPTPPAGGDRVASIVDFAFEPGEVEVAAGSTVTWQNDGAAPHTVTAGDGTFDSGLIAAGGTWSTTFDTPGTFAFTCDFHPEMVGTVVVGTGSAESASPSSQASASATTESVPNFAGAGGETGGAGGAAGAPAAAAPDTSPAAAFREGALRLLLVGFLTAGGVIAFGLAIAGTTRRGKSHRAR